MRNTPETPKTGNGLIQLIWLDGSTRQKRVKLSVNTLNLKKVEQTLSYHRYALPDSKYGVCAIKCH